MLLQKAAMQEDTSLPCPELVPDAYLVFLGPGHFGLDIRDPAWGIKAS